MNLIKNKWFWLVAIVAIAGLGYVYRKNISIFFGGYETSPMGYSYRFIEGKKLDKVQGPGFHIIYEYVLLGPEGDTLENGSKGDVQLHRNYPVEAKTFVDEAMQLGAPGSVIEILVPTDSLKEHDPNSMKLMNLENGKNARFVIHFIKLLNTPDYEEYQTKRMLDRVVRENKMIDAFAAKKTDVTWHLDSAKWIKYYIIGKTENPRFDAGDEVEFHYEIYKLNGELIQSSLGGKKFKITVGRDEQNFPAFDFVVRYLGEGESGFFLVTSDYGFGAEGFLNQVKPYTPLAVKLTDVKRVK